MSSSSALLFFFELSNSNCAHELSSEFKQNGTKIAAFGPTTAKAAELAGLRIDIKAPQPGIPSMTMAIENFINIFCIFNINFIEDEVFIIFL